MSRILRSESASASRKKWLQSIALALRIGASEQIVLEERKDMLAHVQLLLNEIVRSVDQTASAWEKRGYWLKADRFRRDWDWAETAMIKLHQSLSGEDWDSATHTITSIMGAVSKTSVPKHMVSNRPWKGAWRRWASGPLKKKE